MFKLLARDDFREGVFTRDNYRCVVCGEPAVDAHHILERRLWPDGGYYLENGASVCQTHHLECESTKISVDEIRRFAGIQKFPIPPHLYDDQEYDKWGNPILENGTRLKGDLFFDESVQKVIAPYLDQFTDLVKYPRTYHLPWSQNITFDDRIMEDPVWFHGKRVIVTEKMDGENTTMYRNYIHARSLDGRNHPTRNWIKNFHSTIAHNIPDGWRVCVENMYAKHSIKYENLKSYCYGFSIWDERNRCLSWDDTLLCFDMLGIEPVPVLYDGIYDEKAIRAIDLDWDTREVYVVRLADGFDYGSFRKSVAKFVRKDHVRTVKHWMHGQPIERNELGNQG